MTSSDKGAFGARQEPSGSFTRGRHRFFRQMEAPWLHQVHRGGGRPREAVTLQFATALAQ